MSYLIDDWLKTVSPVLKFKDPAINDQSALDEYYTKNNKFPENEIIGTATILNHDSKLHVLTNKHVLDYAGYSIGLVLRVGNQILFYFLSDILNQVNANWVIDQTNDLALSLFVVPNIQPIKFKSIPTTLFCPKKDLYEGWDIFYLGYPVKKADINLFPIVRGGMISAHDLPIPNMILIDALASRGNSGGPCFLKPTPFSVGKAKPIPRKTPFIGIIKEALERETLSRSGWYSSTFIGGLSLVISGDAILNLFNTEDYSKHFEILSATKMRFKFSLHSFSNR